MEQRAQGTLRIWAEPFVPLRVPKLFNLRTDPFERADVTSNTYYDWFIDNDYIALAGDGRGRRSSWRRSRSSRRGRRRRASRSTRSSRSSRRRSTAGAAERRAEPLASWNDGAGEAAVVDFVERVRRGRRVPPEERVAVFDNDGTLWCEKPMPIELGFILQRLAEMAEAGPVAPRASSPGRPRTSRTTPGWAASIEKHYARRRQRREGAPGRRPRRRSRASASTTTRPRRTTFLAHGAAPDARPRPPRLRLRADGRAAALPGGERLHELHRLRRRPRLHAAGHATRCTASRRERVIGSSNALRLRGRRARRLDRATSPSRTSSTTGR